MTVDRAFADLCRDVQSALADFGGYFIERIQHDSADGGTLLIHLQERPTRPDAIVFLSGLAYVSIGDTRDLVGNFVDEIEFTCIPRDQTDWPDGLTLGPRHPGLPDLALLRIVGPTHVEAVAAIVQIYTSSASTG